MRLNLEMKNFSDAVQGATASEICSSSKLDGLHTALATLGENNKHQHKLQACVDSSKLPILLLQFVQK